jgi:hypothetical protein
MSALPTPARSEALRSEVKGVTRRTSRLMEEPQPIRMHVTIMIATFVIPRNIINFL